STRWRRSTRCKSCRMVEPSARRLRRARAKPIASCSLRDDGFRSRSTHPTGRRSRARIVGLVGLAEEQPVAAWVGDLHHASVPRRAFTTGLVVAIVLRRELPVIVGDAAHPDEYLGSRASVAMMLAEVQLQH